MALIMKCLDAWNSLPVRDRSLWVDILTKASKIVLTTHRTWEFASQATLCKRGNKNTKFQILLHVYMQVRVSV
jgi:hypothetical protein